MTLTQAIDFFLIDQQLRGNSDKTIRGYRGYLSRFCAWLEGQGVVGITDLTIGNINAYQIYITNKPAQNSKNDRLTKRTVRTYMRHIKVFIGYCYTEEFIKEPLHTKMKLPKAERPMIEILTEDELTTLFSCLGKKELDLRNRSILMLMVDCGLRLSEVAGLKHEDINFQKGYVTVMGKGMKGRIVPLGVNVRRALLTYITKRRRADAARDDEYLFLSRIRTPISAAAIVLMIRRVKKEADIPRLHAHLLRHTFATNLLVYGIGDVYELSRLLGHSDIKTTEGYLQVASYYTIMEKRERRTFLDMRR